MRKRKKIGISAERRTRTLGHRLAIVTKSRNNAKQRYVFCKWNQHSTFSLDIAADETQKLCNVFDCSKGLFIAEVVNGLSGKLTVKCNAQEQQTLIYFILKST